MILEAINEYPLPALDLTNRAVFMENLLFVYGLIVASEPLLEEALRRPLPVEVKKYYAEHLEEERGHAAWLLEDLQSAGVEPPLVNWQAAQIAGTQYYLIRHVSPVALLGYIAALECRPMPPTTVELLEATHGKELMRTLRYHAEHDVDHGADVLKLIDSFGAADLPLIAMSARQSALGLKYALLTCQSAGEFPMESAF